MVIAILVLIIVFFVGFFTGGFCEVEVVRKDIESGLIKSDHKVYKVTEMKGSSND